MELKDVYDLILEGLEMPLSYLMNPEKRIYIVYLLSSGLLAYYVYYKAKYKTSFLKYIFNKKVWLSKSSFTDYFLVFFNSFIKILLIGPYLMFGLYLAFYTNEYLITQFGYPTTGLGVTTTLVLYTITLTIVNDFASFLIHYIMHKVPVLWEFHKVHHSATSLNPITQYRIHPIELIINNARGIVMFGLVTGLFDYLSNHQVHKMMFLGANVFGFIFMFMGANLRHSHVKLRYPKVLEYIFISPVQHQIHHSKNPIHFDRNMGSKLAIWDWLFGTLVLSKNTKHLDFGLGKEDDDFDSFWKNLIRPFQNLGTRIASLFGK